MSLVSILFTLSVPSFFPEDKFPVTEIIHFPFFCLYVCLTQLEPSTSGKYSRLVELQYMNRASICRATKCRREELVGGTHPEKKSTCKLSQRRACGRDPPEKKKKQKIILSRYKLSQRRACGRDPPGKKEKNKSLWLELVACCL
jgi:hypothetical protein